MTKAQDWIRDHLIVSLIGAVAVGLVVGAALIPRKPDPEVGHRSKAALVAFCRGIYSGIAHDPEAINEATVELDDLMAAGIDPELEHVLTKGRVSLREVQTGTIINRPKYRTVGDAVAAIQKLEPRLKSRYGQDFR